MSKKIAVVLLNLGGPDSLEAVKPFLFNLFYDKAIINLPNPFRFILAKFISTRREKIAREIYAKMGGKSPILEITKKQADLLEKNLNQQKLNEFRVFISMRYWHPFADETLLELEKFGAEEVILLPLYPQFSTTTVDSSFLSFSKISNINFKKICCYYDNPSFIKSHVDKIKKALDNIDKNERYRILFSAHGLPEKIIKNGDPYQWQVEQTVANIIKFLDKKLDYKICYQSKVGPMKWLEPATEKEIEEAAKENINLLVVPIAFVSDHSETLVELDIEYRDVFQKLSDKKYIRVEALNGNEDYIKALEELVYEAMAGKKRGECPNKFCKCYMRQ